MGQIVTVVVLIQVDTIRYMEIVDRRKVETRLPIIQTLVICVFSFTRVNGYFTEIFQVLTLKNTEQLIIL